MNEDFFTEGNHGNKGFSSFPSLTSVETLLTKGNQGNKIKVDIKVMLESKPLFAVVSCHEE